uniref:Uncharacterized protein n=1 Tax=Setaria digitata TaxID=48799 RepID=A0A915Q419_9BILA
MLESEVGSNYEKEFHFFLQSMKGESRMSPRSCYGVNSDAIRESSRGCIAALDGSSGRHHLKVSVNKSAMKSFTPGDVHTESHEHVTYSRSAADFGHSRRLGHRVVEQHREIIRRFKEGEASEREWKSRSATIFVDTNKGSRALHASVRLQSCDNECFALRVILHCTIFIMRLQLFLYVMMFTLTSGSLRGDGWMRPMEKDVNPSRHLQYFLKLLSNYGYMDQAKKDIPVCSLINNLSIQDCWKCEPSPEELNECDEALLTRGRTCGILQSRFVERGYHCIVEILNCFPKSGASHQAGFIVARGRLVDPLNSNDTSMRYFPLNSPVGTRDVIITCTLDGIWEAVSSNGDRLEVGQIQCITSGYQAMNYISPYISEIYSRR